MESIIEQVGELSFNLMDDLKHEKDDFQVKKSLLNHLKNVSSMSDSKVIIPDFKVGV